MASDGPPKPLVPPPPQLSSTANAGPGGGAKPTSTDDDAWLALLEDEPASPAEQDELDDDPDEDAATIAQSPRERESPPVDDVEVQAELVEEEPAAPPPRRGVLPPPRSEGRRVQPLAPKTRSKVPERPSAAGLPAGLRPPGAAQAREREDTDVLIASAVAALTHRDTHLEEDPDAVAGPAASGVVVASGSDSPHAPHAATRAPHARAETRRIPPLWLGLGVAAAALLLLAVFTRGSSDDATHAPDDSPSAAPAVADAKPSGATPQPLAAAEPDLPPLPVDVAPELGGALAEALDVGGDLAPALDVGSAEEDLDASDEGVSPEEDANAEPAPSRSSRRGRNKRRGESTAKDAPRPAPTSATASEEPDADALLADAKKALAAGQARKAYALASKSRRAKKTSAALIVMARAACRFGNESQAKSAFDQLSLSDRRGIRSECRDHGVRLGL